jgi:hypothetical protein
MNSFANKVLVPLILSAAVVISTPSADTSGKVNFVPFYMVSRGLSNIDINMIDGSYIASYAKKFIGIRYSYGASGPYAFDCSGFTMHVMQCFGIFLPHSASMQYESGTDISKEELVPGDLVFFATSGGRSITHVGIYVGENKFIHASSSGVMINDLDESYYKTRFVKSSRVVKQNKE